MALSIRAARHVYLEANGDEVPMEEARHRDGGFPALVIDFIDGRSARLHHEQHLLTYDPPGVALGFDDVVYRGGHPDDGSPVVRVGATDDPHVVNLVIGYLRALQTHYKPGPVNLTTGVVD